MLRVCFFLLTIGGIFPCAPNVGALEYKWEDVGYSPALERNKFIWDESNEIQRAAYLELYNSAIRYSLKNIGKPVKTLDLAKAGPRVAIFHSVTFEAISMLYREYGDEVKAAEYAHRFWSVSRGNPAPDMLNADGSPTEDAINAYEQAGMYKELLQFYPIAYNEKMKWLALSTDTKLIKTDFKKYLQRWPDYAKNYRDFMDKWAKAKILARTVKPKPLAPSVQTHEWFYSEKQDEVLKALEYYHANKVQFMLEKAVKHKYPVVAAKAKEYLESLAKAGTNGKESK